MRAPFTMTRLSLAATALLAVAGAGCGDLQAIAEDILNHKNNSSSDGGTSSDGSRPTGCFLAGVQYAEGDSFPKDDCNTCYCKAGSITCASSGKCAPAPACKEFTFAASEQCLGIDQFQSTAKQACDKLNMLLSSVSLDKVCDDKSAHTGRYSCCLPDAGGGTPSQSCEKVNDGDKPTSCLGYSAWKDRGIKACMVRGETLNDVVLGAACGAEPQSASSATYVCCGPAAPPPADPCTSLDGGGGAGSCKPSSIWDAYGAEACAALGMSLIDISYSGACSKTGPDYANAIYKCCGGPAKPTTSKCAAEDGDSKCQLCWDANGVSAPCATQPSPAVK